MTDGTGPATFAAALRDSRLWRGLTQEQLATASTVSVRAIRDLESGATAGPRTQTIDLLADALGLDGAGRDALVRAARQSTPAPASAPPAPADRPARPRPDQLLRDVADFVGRDDIVRALVDALTPGEGG